MPRRQKPVFSDSPLIIVTQESGLSEWMKSLDCSEAELLEAMSAVGNSSQAVRNYLHGGKGPWQWVAAAA